jgi:uncharacterized OB-fold protein
MNAPTSRSAVDWFDPEKPCLLGSACTSCGSVFFPPTIDFCRNPRCSGEEFERKPLSTRGTVWSHTTNHYQPPAPYVSPDPFEPYTVAAVELAAEGLVVLGQLSSSSRPVKVGDTVRLVSEVLFKSEQEEPLVWRWTYDDGEVSTHE